MKTINDVNDLKVGHELYAPALDRYFVVDRYEHIDKDNIQDWRIYVRPSNKNPKEDGFSIYLNELKSLDYRISDGVGGAGNG
ncbi:hypothetical protein [Aquimarina sp. 2201CG5-10]|uniref:hypothetical protein n=1 Tax=Aquimarina callyspongiae TaxID=3098150 RepID=UPI002AB56A9B|nr:hypothetical protein [Aquimarina sp. 2201CG5-10]MDY8137581.1 hypothetical protein [Aquimarina sp. 2201CG5-10]